MFQRGSAGAIDLKANNFDVLRLLFATMVVVFHIGILSREPALAWMWQHVSATFAVQAFFVVSGFLVTMSYERSSTFRAYIEKRVRRIFPAYVVVVLGATVLCSWVSSLSAAEYWSSVGVWKYIFFNLILSNFNTPSLPGVFQSNWENAVNGSLWTIKIEIGFYLFVPPMVWAIRKWGYRRVLLSVFVFSLLWKSGFMWGEKVSGVAMYGKLAKQLPGQLAFFAGGAWGYYQVLDGRRLSAIWAFVGVVLYVIADGYSFELLAPFAVTAIVYWAAISAPTVRGITKYGDFSYGTYLCHFPIVQTLIALGLFSKSPLLGVGGVLLVVAVLAFISWNFIEKPFLGERGRSFSMVFTKA